MRLVIRSINHRTTTILHYYEHLTLSIGLYPHSAHFASPNQAINMRSLRSTAGATLVFSLFFPALVMAIGTIDCGRIQTEGVQFDLSKLSGPHAVMHSIEQPPVTKNTTFTIDICRPLERPKSTHEDNEFCPGGTRGTPQGA